MDKIEKALKKLSSKERILFKKILISIENGQFNKFDIKKLKNRADIYRLRKGKMRIIFRIEDKEIAILTLEKRSDNTYI